MTIKNMLPCKICSKSFEYIPGYSGNARQFCKNCRNTVDEAELNRIEEEMIKEKNRYLIGAPKRKSEYDPIEILVDGELPEFTSDSDRFVCAMEMATFLRQQKGGFCGMEKRTAELMEHLGTVHATLLMKQWTLPMMEHAAKHVAFNVILKKILNIVT